MRKIIFLSMMFIIMLTGCDLSSMDTLSCSYNTTSGLVSATTKYDIDHQNDEVKKVRITYDYMTEANNDDGNNNMDGVGTGTDGTTNDTQIDNDGIIDGIVGSAIDTVIGGISDVILDVSGLKDRHANIQNMYGNINGFSTQNVINTDNNYKVTYVIDFDTISDDDLTTLNLSRDFNILRTNYISQGFTCN